MAGADWTEAQLQAIQAQRDHILVSAAAGAGKTAVLVERIVRMLMQEDDPLDLDRLLVMTFTRAAAGQMKARIHKAIRKALEEHPDHAHLRLQLMKLQNARICTIDALCSSIVRDHFQDIDLDPGFRIAEEAEIRMLQRDTLQTVLEEAYREGDEQFLNLADYYMDRNDQKLEEIILTLYRYAQSHPEPAAWLDASAYPYEQAGDMYREEPDRQQPEGLQNWMSVFAQLVEDQLREAAQLALEGERIALMNHGPEPFADIFRDICAFIDTLQGQTFDYRRAAITDYLRNWKKAPRISVKNDDVDEDLKEQASAIRKDIKKILTDLTERFLYDDLEKIYADMALCSDTARALATLTLRFAQAFRQAKEERQIADFSDVAHYALQVLIRYDASGYILRDENNVPVYTPAADQMAASLDEIIVDEYQDTNMLQEYLVNALSAARFGRPDVFMVGDVKQSIYGFRMACPDLFRDRMDRYQQGTEDGRLIILDRNFRSRKEVLGFTNRIFRQSMIREVGGIDYRSGHDLVYGGIYGDQPETDPAYIPQILMIHGSGEQARMMEAYEIARKIEELTAGGDYDLSDIVILTRNSDNPQLERVLHERGIPVLKSSGSGFFDSFEIRLTLNLLKIIDNPYQDIPFAAVLHSPLCGADASDLARIRLAGGPGVSLYECLKCYEENDRFAGFLNRLEEYRRRAGYMGILEFVEYVLRDSSLSLVIASMPQGRDRLANLGFLRSMVQSFARGSYTGLFHFIRYIRELQDSDTDFGIVTAAASEARAVRMMTIHRAKGLEFPVVFLACCGRKFNETDLNASIIPDRDLGIGLELRDPDTRMIRKTILMETIRQKQKISTYAEEQRLLYVALTRAREKLFITGTDQHLEARIKKWQQDHADADRVLESGRIMQAGSFLALLGLTLFPFAPADTGFALQIAQTQDLEEERVEEAAQLNALRGALQECVQADIGESDITGRIDLTYPFRKAAHIQGKISASQLERREEKTERKPAAGGKETAAQRAARGIAYHTCFELLDHTKDPEEQLAQWVQEGRVEPQAVDPEDLRAFMRSPLGLRMAQAFRRNRLFREKQFTLGYIMDIHREQTLTGVQYASDEPDEEMLLVQGIIDAWFTETDADGSEHIILADYKTDQNVDEQHFIHNYSPQLDAYADALERATGLPVTEKIIYSVYLGREIRI